MSPIAEKMAPVAARLSAIRSSIRRLYALDGLSRLILILAVFFVVTFLVDWSLILPPPVRVILLIAGLGLAGWIILRRILYPLGVRISDDDLALFVERQYPQLNDRLISALQLARNPGAVPGAGSNAAYNSPELVDALVADAEKAVGSIDFRSVVVSKYVGKVAAWGGGVLLVLVLLGAKYSTYSSIYFNRILGGTQKWPQRTYLNVLDFVDHHKVVPRGDDAVIAVEVDGRVPSKILLHYTFKTGESGRELMVSLAGGKRFQYKFPTVSGPFEFHVTGGDDETALHTVDTVTPPSIEGVKLFFEYPPYMRKPGTPPDRPESIGNVVAPLHTKVRFEVLTNEDLDSAFLALGFEGKETVVALPVGKTPEGKPRTLAGGFTVTEPSSEYALQLKAHNGLGNRDPIRFKIKGLEDRPPEVAVQDPLGDEFVTELCERPLLVETKDDYGIARIVLESRVLSQTPDKSTDWAALEFTREQNSREYGEPAIRSEHVIDIARLKLQAGDHVEFKVRADDYKDIGAKNFKVSRVFKLSIVPVGTLEKELQDAIEKIKIVLKQQKTREENAWNRTGRLIQNYGRAELLTPEQQSEVRQAALEQNDITSKLEGARKDIRYIQRRGVYNKIYNESAAAKLQGAVDELGALVGDPNEPTRNPISRVAASRLDQAAKPKTGPERTSELREAQGHQSLTIAGIQRALENLEKWSSYQEVIRLARDLKKLQDDTNDEIKKGK